MAVGRLSVRLDAPLSRPVEKDAVEIELDLPAGRDEVIPWRSRCRNCCGFWGRGRR
ncbi:MAG TPA: hypothetical protein GX513_12290 [Firmicutes bacterium]|nr:hypothetical protein [Bacillota bacterium]